MAVCCQAVTRHSFCFLCHHLRQTEWDRSNSTQEISFKLSNSYLVSQGLLQLNKPQCSQENCFVWCAHKLMFQPKCCIWQITQWFNNVPYWVELYWVILFSTMPFYTTSYCIVLFYIKTYCIKSYFIKLHPSVLSYIKLHYIILYHMIYNVLYCIVWYNISNGFVLYHVIPGYIILYCIHLYLVISFHFILSYIILYCTLISFNILLHLIIKWVPKRFFFNYSQCKNIFHILFSNFYLQGQLKTGLSHRQFLLKVPIKVKATLFW